MRGVFPTLWLPALILLGSAALAGENSFGGEMGLGVGHSSNALLVPGGGASGSYLPYTLEGAWLRTFGEDHRFRLRFTADGWRHNDASLRNGDERHMDLEARWRWRMRSTESARTWLSLHLEAGHDREMLVRRSTGTDFVHESDGGTVNLRERYVSRHYDLELGLVRRTRRGRLSLDLDLRRRDYQYDYRDVPTVDSLDNDRLRISGRYRRDLGRRVELAAEGSLAWRRYDEKFPLDENADDVLDGPAQSYRYRAVEMSVNWRPLPGRKLRERMEIGLERTLERREDLYRGMLDRTRHDWEFDVRLDLPRGVEIDLELSRDKRTYDSYPVNGKIGNPLFRQEEREARVDVAVPLGKGLLLEMSGLRLDSDSTHPLYRYDETRGETLLVWRF